MKLLILSPYPPYPPRGGGALRIYNLIRGLAARHSITCLTFAPDEAAMAAMAPLSDYCRLKSVIGPPPRSTLRRALTTMASLLPDMAHRNASPAYAAALKTLLAREHFDLLQAESIEMAGFALRLPGAPLRVLDEFNAEYLLQRRTAINDLRRPTTPRRLAGGLYSLAQWLKLAAYERRLLQAYDRVLVVSRDDREALRRLLPAADPAIIPNGVDCDYFAPLQVAHSAAQPPALLFTGTLDYRPNIDALHWFVHEVLPLIRATQPAVRLVIVGRNPAPAVRALHDGSMVELVGEVADVRPAIAAAAVYVIPMRIGGGVRFKLLEALAMEAPVVSTAMGAEGIDEIRDGEHVLLGDTPAAFAAATLRLIGDRRLAGRLGRAGRVLVRGAYDWRSIVPRLETVYSEALP